MRHLVRGFIAGCAVISAAFVTSPVKANLVTLQEAGVPQGTLSDGGASVTFLGYISPLTLDNVAPFIAVTTTVNPADQATLMPIANTWFGTTFAVGDDHRTNIAGGGDNVVIRYIHDVLLAHNRAAANGVLPKSRWRAPSDLYVVTGGRGWT